MKDIKEWFIHPKKKCIGCKKHKRSAKQRKYYIQAAGLTVTSMGEICDECFNSFKKHNI